MDDPLDFKHRVAPDWPRVLALVLARAAAGGARALVACDLDSTLFDNRPRQARIVREYGAAHGVAPLERCEARHFETGWDMREAMRRCGLAPAGVEAHHGPLRRWWLERFFTSEYCREDVAIAGAAAFTHAVVRTGAQLAYVTGRPERMRPGTLEALARCGLAPPREGAGVHLLMKPTLEEHDDAYKRAAHARLGELGEVVAAFDNEPTHANDYRLRFPDATTVLLATDHSRRPVTLLEGILVIPHFDAPP